MPVTIEYMRYLLLSAAHAFDGKRGRSGVLSYLRGEATANTMKLGSDSGIKHLYGVLRGVDTAEIQEVLNSLLTARMLEIRKVASGEQEFPLLYLTEPGQRELTRLSALGFESVGSEGLTVDRLLQSFIMIAALIDKLSSSGAEPDSEFRQYLELFGKAIGVNAEVHLATQPGRKQFALLLEKHLHSGIFAFLPELEAQCLRLRSGFSPPQQLDLGALNSLFGQVDVEGIARRGASRIVDKAWEHRNAIHSVLSFFTVARRQ